MRKQKEEIVFGRHAVEAVLRFHPETIYTLYVCDDKKNKSLNQIAEKASQAGVPIKWLPKASLDKMSSNESHQGLLASCALAPTYSEKDIPLLLEKAENSPLILVLDGIQDPHNLGACLRTADAFGVTFVMASKNQSASLTTVVHKVSSGGSRAIPFVQVPNLSRGIETLKKHGVWIIGSAGNATKTLNQVDMTSPIALVMGNEGSGMHQKIAESCDFLIQIPMLGYVESLNVSVATGICLYECSRQRG